MENILVNGKMVKEKEKEYIIGMMENLKVINMMVNGKMIKKMGKVFFIIKMEKVVMFEMESQ